MSQWKCPNADDVKNTKPLKERELAVDPTRNEWLQVDFLEFLATNVDLRIVLFQLQEPSILTS